MNQRDKIESALNRVVKTDLLVAAVTLIVRIEQHRQGERKGFIATQDFAASEGLVGRAVVNDQHLDVVVVQQAGGDSAQRLLNRPLGVVGNDEDQQPLTNVPAHEYL